MDVLLPELLACMSEYLVGNLCPGIFFIIGALTGLPCCRPDLGVECCMSVYVFLLAFLTMACPLRILPVPVLQGLSVGIERWIELTDGLMQAITGT